MPDTVLTAECRDELNDLFETRRDDHNGRERLVWASASVGSDMAELEFTVTFGADIWMQQMRLLQGICEQYGAELYYSHRSQRTLGFAPTSTGVMKLPYRLMIRPGGNPYRGSMYSKLSLECECGQYIDPSSFRCAECGVATTCSFCFRSKHFTSLLTVEEDSRGVCACQDCDRQCNYGGCENFSGSTGPRCDEHMGSEYGMFTCISCRFQGYPDAEEVVTDSAGETWCDSCWSERPMCHNCERGPDEVEVRWTGDEYDERYLCTDCTAAERVAIAERIEYEGVIEHGMLELAHLPDRPARATSVEQEMTIGGTAGEQLAETLYQHGLTPYDYVEGYNSSGHDGFCHLERDSSVAGVELIYNRVDFSNEDEQQKAAAALLMVRGSGATFDATCGTHFHVDAHGLLVPDAKNLVIVYSYLEDLVYRIGAAGYESHRTVMRKGRNYAKSIKKEEWKDAKHFGKDYLRTADHTDSLNLQHYYRAMSTCRCGAIEFGQQADCECHLPKNTFEWRVFNGTADPRRLRAWMALAHAITAWAQDRKIRYADFRPLSFGQPHDKGATEERLKFALQVLPMTEAEKADVVWCLLNTTLPHPFTDGEIEGMVGPYTPERELPPAPEFGFRTKVASPRTTIEYTFTEANAIPSNVLPDFYRMSVIPQFDPASESWYVPSEREES